MATEALTGTCPDTFTVCGPPQVALGKLLVAVPIAGALLAALGGAIVLLRWMRSGPHPQPASAAALAVVIAGSGLSAVIHDRWVPPGPVVYYDEFLHAETTANLALRGSPSPCCGYDNDLCLPGGPIEWPLSTHLASAALTRWSSSPNIHRAMRSRQLLNRTLSLVSPVLAFAWVLLLVPEVAAASVVSLALALWPGAIRLQTTADLTPGALFFVLLACLAVEVERRRPGWAATAATVGAFAMAAHARLEVALILPWILWRTPRRWAVALAAPLTVAPLVWLYLDGKSTTIGWTPDALSQLRRHLPIDLAFLFSTSGALPELSLLALLGLRQRSLWPLFATAAGLLLFIASYTFGEFRSDADGFRYAILIVALLLPLGAAGIAALMERASAPRAVMGALLGAAVLGPLATQRPILEMTNPVAKLDAVIRDSSLGSLRPKAIVTRSVAYARAVTSAENIVERCTEGGFDHLFEAGPLYLRTWGDRGPEPYGYGCSKWIAATVSDSPDGMGPWLDFWDLSCHQD